MTRREIIERAITFKNPPRIGIKFDVVGVNDCFDVWTVDPTGWTWEFGPERNDEWGCLWRRSAVNNTGQVVGHPLQNLDALTEYRWPDPEDPRRFAGFAEQLAGAEDRFVMFCFGHGIWERLYMLRGMSETLMDLHRRPRQTHEIIDRVLEHHLRVLRSVVKIAAERGARIDAAAMADDWGVQDRAFISLKHFREFFKPRYQRWFDEIKSLGLHPWMHSCGKINDLLEELIDCGLEVINSQQPNTVGIDEMSRRFRGRICFESIVDTQSTLPRGSHDEIRGQAAELVEKWGTPAGGFIASDYNDAAAIGVTNDRRLIMFEAFARAGGYADCDAVLHHYHQRGGTSGHGFGRHTSASEPTRQE